MEEILVDAGFDEPDERDFPHEEVFEFGGATNDILVNNRSPIYNQNAQKFTYYACPIYGLTHAYNEGNGIESEKIGIAIPFEDPLKVTQEIVDSKSDWFSTTRGGSMQGALKHFKDTGRIAGYTLVKKAQAQGIDGIFSALDKGFILYSGSRNINWKEMSKVRDGKVITGPSYGHIFCIDGYKIEDGVKYVRIRQSIGDKYFDKGFCWMKEDQVDVLYSVYAIIDQSNRKDILLYKSIQKGIWNGKRGSEVATRYELAAMLIRASGKASNEIWNKTNAEYLPTREELMIMQIRAFGKSDENANTREEIALFCVENMK